MALPFKAIARPDGLLEIQQNLAMGLRGAGCNAAAGGGGGRHLAQKNVTLTYPRQPAAAAASLSATHRARRGGDGRTRRRRVNPPVPAFKRRERRPEVDQAAEEARRRRKEQVLASGNAKLRRCVRTIRGVLRMMRGSEELLRGDEAQRAERLFHTAAQGGAGLSTVRGIRVFLATLGLATPERQVRALLQRASCREGRPISLESLKRIMRSRKRNAQETGARMVREGFNALGNGAATLSGDATREWLRDAASIGVLLPPVAVGSAAADGGDGGGGGGSPDAAGSGDEISFEAFKKLFIALGKGVDGEAAAANEASGEAGAAGTGLPSDGFLSGGSQGDSEVDGRGGEGSGGGGGGGGAGVGGVGGAAPEHQQTPGSHPQAQAHGGGVSHGGVGGGAAGEMIRRLGEQDPKDLLHLLNAQTMEWLAMDAAAAPLHADGSGEREAKHPRAERGVDRDGRRRRRRRRRAADEEDEDGDVGAADEDAAGRPAGGDGVAEAADTAARSKVWRWCHMPLPQPHPPAGRRAKGGRDAAAAAAAALPSCADPLSQSVALAQVLCGPRTWRQVGGEGVPPPPGLLRPIHGASHLHPAAPEQPRLHTVCNGMRRVRASLLHTATTTTSSTLLGFPFLCCCVVQTGPSDIRGPYLTKTFERKTLRQTSVPHTETRASTAKT